MPPGRRHGGFQKGNTARMDFLKKQKEREDPASASTHRSTAVRPSVPVSPMVLRQRPEAIPHLGRSTYAEIQHHVLQDGFFIGVVSSVQSFLADLNQHVRCRTKNCRGSLVCVGQRQLGLGGGLEVKIACSCCAQKLSFHSSPTTREGKNLAGFACMVASFLAGSTYAEYARTFAPLLGGFVFSHETFRKMMIGLHGPVEQLLKWEVEVGRKILQELPLDTLGSWSQAVTSADGCYHVRGHFSLNMTVTAVDYFRGFLIGYVHRCGKGSKPSPDSEDNWKGTAKAAEAAGTGELFAQLKDYGMNLAISVQDHDSSSLLRIKSVYPDAQTLICFGHHNRAFGKALEKLNLVKGPSCLQLPGGCIPKALIIRSKTNHLAIAKDSDGNPRVYRRKMQELGRYHARGIHEWEEGGCCSHPLLVCSCSLNCHPGSLKCEGKKYESTLKISCPFHAQLFEEECFKRGEACFSVIHPILKKAHSNKPEAVNAVIAKMRKKGTSLERTHYETKTNIGLLEANRTAMFNHDPSYDWVIKILENLKLPVFPALIDQLASMRRERNKKLESRKTEEAKRSRIHQKKKRQEEQEKRRSFTKGQEKTLGELSYGSESQGLWASYPLLARIGATMPSSGPPFDPTAPALAVILDLETTGFGNADDIIQLACSVIEYDGARFLKPTCPATFSTLINTPKSLSGSQHVHGITSEMLLGAPSFLQAFHSFLSFLQQFPPFKPMLLIAHNLSFDYRILQANCKRRFIDLEASLVPKITARTCSLSLAKRIPQSSLKLPLQRTATGRRSFSLGSLFMAITGQPLQHAHDASADVAGLVEVLCSDQFGACWRSSKQESLIEIPSPAKAVKIKAARNPRIPCQCGRLRHTKGITCPFWEKKKAGSESRKKK